MSHRGRYYGKPEYRAVEVVPSSAQETGFRVLGSVRAVNSRQALKIFYRDGLGKKAVPYSVLANSAWEVGAEDVTT